MKLTTLCYIEKDEKYLMIHRIKKKHDVNKDKWIGIVIVVYKSQDAPEPVVCERQTGLLLRLPEDTVLRTLPAFKLSADADPFVLIDGRGKNSDFKNQRSIGRIDSAGFWKKLEKYSLTDKRI